jgi:large subunit ribosomal protein L10
MPRPEKVQAVADIKERLEDSTAVFLAEYAGLSVGEQQELRRGLRAAGSELKIVKMTLARIAATELGHEDLIADLSGPTALAFASGEAAAAAKVLRDFAKDHEQLILKSGLLSGEPLTAARVEQLADLDSREVLLAKIAGAFEAPMSGLAGLMAALPRNLASMILQLIDKFPPEETAAVDAEPEASEAEEAEEPAEESTTAEATPEAEMPEEPAAEDSVAEEAASEAEAAPEATEEESATDEPAPEAGATEDLSDDAADEASNEAPQATTDDETAETAEEE